MKRRNPPQIHITESIGPPPVVEPASARSRVLELPSSRCTRSFAWNYPETDIANSPE
jgi:hypothetical protein